MALVLTTLALSKKKTKQFVNVSYQLKLRGRFSSSVPGGMRWFALPEPWRCFKSYELSSSGIV